MKKIFYILWVALFAFTGIILQSCKKEKENG